MQTPSDRLGAGPDATASYAELKVCSVVFRAGKYRSAAHCDHRYVGLHTCLLLLSCVLGVSLLFQAHPFFGGKFAEVATSPPPYVPPPPTKPHLIDGATPDWDNLGDATCLNLPVRERSIREIMMAGASGARAASTPPRTSDAGGPPSAAPTSPPTPLHDGAYWFVLPFVPCVESHSDGGVVAWSRT